MMQSRALAIGGAFFLLLGAASAQVSAQEASTNFSSGPAWPTESEKPSTQTRDLPLTPSQELAVSNHAMPVLKPGEYGTTVDNENNANTHTPDGDLDKYLFKTSSISPIEFNIVLPNGSAGRAGTLRMDVYDIDASSGEVDVVYLNNQRIGVLNGQDGKWGVNIFTIPPGLLVNGRNTVKIDIDTATSGSWAVSVDWGIIALGASTTTPAITRCWVAPVEQKQGNFVNFFAETNAAFDAVKVSVAGRTLTLTDPDKDNVWSTQWQIPTTVPKANHGLRFGALRGTTTVSTCPTLKVN